LQVWVVGQFDCDSAGPWQTRLDRKFQPSSQARDDIASGKSRIVNLRQRNKVCKIWTENPECFRLNPLHHTSGPYA